MRLAKLMILTLSSAGILFLGACSSSETPKSEAPKPENPPTAAKTVEAAAKADAKAQESHNAGDGHEHKEGDGHDHAKEGSHGKGGQIVEMGEYHLEFLTHKVDNGLSLDFILGKGEAHTPVADAKVTAQVQLPDGTQQALDMKYDIGEKAYKVTFLKDAPGEYGVVILTNVGGKKMNSRFSFNQ
jgi:hypothetical protein